MAPRSWDCVSAQPLISCALSHTQVGSWMVVHASLFLADCRVKVQVVLERGGTNRTPCAADVAGGVSTSRKPDVLPVHTLPHASGNVSRPQV